MSWSYNILAYGEGLNHGIAGQCSKFFINPKGQRVDGISFAVEGPSNPLFEYTYLPNGIIEVKYTPVFQGVYKIHIKNHGKHITSSPFAIMVKNENTRQYMPIRRSQTTKIASPRQQQHQIQIQQQQQQQQQTKVSPQCSPRIRQNQFQNQQNHFQSPNQIQPAQGQGQGQGRWGKLPSAWDIKLYGEALANGKSLITNQFILDSRFSGIINPASGLTAFMEGPGRVEVGFKENLDGTIHVQYKPYSSGIYKLHLKYGDDILVGSPFSINVN